MGAQPLTQEDRLPDKTGAVGKTGHFDHPIHGLFPSPGAHGDPLLVFIGLDRTVDSQVQGHGPAVSFRVLGIPFQGRADRFIDDAELIIISKTGSRRTVLLSARAIKGETKDIAYSISVQKDITAQKYAEEQIRSSLEEKKALLKEIHHRVKNNLQVISSLLNLQAHYIDQEKYQHFFRESQDRIKTMVLIHEKLYQSENLAAVSPSDYINSIVNHLMDSYQVGTGRIEFDSTIDDVPIDIDLAIPCGLIINELVSNALKHAFGPEHTVDAPRITVSLIRKHNHLILSISDNGPGMPPGIHPETSKTLGLQLVHSLAKQLNATIEVNRHHGSSFIFTFDVKH